MLTELQKNHSIHQNVFNGYVKALKETKDINEYSIIWQSLERYAKDIQDYYKYDSYMIEYIEMPNRMRIISGIEFVDIMNNKKSDIYKF